MLYNIIYDFFYGQFNSEYIENYSMTIMGETTSLASWLSNTATITLMVLGIVWLIMVVVWIFRVFAGLIKV